MDHLTPRRMTSVEAMDVLSLLQRAFAGMAGRIDPPSSLHQLTEAEIVTKAVWVLGTPPRACVFLEERPDALYLSKLAVDLNARGQGLSRRLVNLAEGQARKAGLFALELETRVELTENHAIFQRMGFVEVARTAHPGYARPTSLRMRLDLNQTPAANAATPK